MIGIYKFTNNINGKIYIGQSVDIERRYREHVCHYKKSAKYTPINKALKKYGKDNFTFEIIKLCDKDELNYYETKYIKEYNSTDKKIGYNINKGGQDNSHCTKKVYQIDYHTGDIIQMFDSIVEASEKVTGSKSNGTSITGCCKGRKVSCFGYAWCYVDDYNKERYINYKQKSDERHREKLRQLRLGSKLSEETKKKIGDSERGSKLSEETIRKIVEKKKKKVICVETNIVYDSIKSASEMNNICSSGIINACRGKYQTCNGYHWKYFEGVN